MLQFSCVIVHEVVEAEAVPLTLVLYRMSMNAVDHRVVKCEPHL